MPVTYNKATSADEALKQIDGLIDAHTRATYPNAEDLSSTLYAINASVDGQFAGGIAFTHLGETIHVNALAVDQKYRQQDIGSNLLSRAEEFALTLDVHTVTLSTLSYQALGFYQKQGYSLAGEVSDFPRRGVTKYFLYKRLSNY